MNVEELLELMEETLEAGTAVPFAASKRVVDVDRMRDIIDEVRNNLPDEVRESKKIVNDREQIMKNARILNGDLNDYNAWAEIAFSGNIAHNNLLGVGREQDWGCHAMEHELSALYHVDHGAGLAVVTPAWMKYVSPKHQEIFVQFAVNVMGVEGSFREPEAIIREGISRLERFYRELGLPTTMEELDILPGDFPLMAEQAVSVRGPVGSLEKLDVRDVEAIYRLGCSNIQHA